MTDIERFLRALEPPEAAGGAACDDFWLHGGEREPPTDGDHALRCQFLAQDAIGDYLAGLQTGQGRTAPQVLNGGTSKPTAPVDFAALDRDWKADEIPLPLCEFLAYGAGLAYRKSGLIRQDLLGLDHKGRSYREGIDQVAFFDTWKKPRSRKRYSDTQALVFVHQRTGYIIFRGSDSFADWGNNLNTRMTDKTYPHLDTAPQTFIGSPRPARHTGFAIAWGNVAPDVRHWAEDQLRQGRIDKVLFSGHSLGGALAILAAHHFATQRICPIHAVITFGAPKVGGHEFKADYENPRLGLKDRTLRIESAEDWVTTVSSQADDEHVGHAWRFKKRPMRPAWQMLLYSPLIDVEKSAKRKVERLEAKKRKAEVAARREDGKPGRMSNAPPNQTGGRQTWNDIALQLTATVLWYIARALVLAVAAHSVERRYGLYLSTLSYQRIRAYRERAAHRTYELGGRQENKRILLDAAFSEARRDLALHLAKVRGRHPRTFRHLKDRPIRVESSAKLSQLLSKYTHYVA